jgi:hypothetical protein
MIETDELKVFTEWFNKWWTNEHHKVPYPADNNYMKYVNAYAIASGAWMASKKYHEEQVKQ